MEVESGAHWSAHLPHVTPGQTFVVAGQETLLSVAMAVEPDALVHFVYAPAAELNGQLPRQKRRIAFAYYGARCKAMETEPEPWAAHVGEELQGDS